MGWKRNTHRKKKNSLKVWSDYSTSVQNDTSFQHPIDDRVHRDCCQQLFKWTKDFIISLNIAIDLHLFQTAQEIKRKRVPVRWRNLIIYIPHEKLWTWNVISFLNKDTVFYQISLKSTCWDINNSNHCKKICICIDRYVKIYVPFRWWHWKRNIYENIKNVMIRTIWRERQRICKYTPSFRGIAVIYADSFCRQNWWLVHRWYCSKFISLEDYKSSIPPISCEPLKLFPHERSRIHIIVHVVMCTFLGRANQT